MTIVFMGGELGAFTPSMSSVDESASVAYNSSFARCGLEVRGGGSSNPDLPYAQTAEWTEESGDLFLHFEEEVANVDALVLGVLDVVYLYQADDTAVFRIVQYYDSSTSRVWTMQYLNASAVWTNAGAAVTVSSYRNAYDWHVNPTAGTMALYSAGTEIRTVSGLSLGHITGVAYARFFGAALGRSISQVIAADESTIGWRLATIYPSGAGATTDWTGTYTEIDETTNDDADFINSSTNDQVELVTGTSPTLTGYTVRAVGITARAKRGSSGPANLRFVLRSSGSNYDNGADIPLSLGYGAYQAIWETNPATSAAWVNSAISSLQYGVKART